jgi:hypothetical protein
MLFGDVRAWRRLTWRAWAERRRDRGTSPAVDPGIERANAEAVAWLGRAQDQSTTADGGVARHYSLINGWSASYPETTGYIVPTLLDYAHRYAAEEVRERARRMLDWLVSIQFPEGGFQGGMVDAEPRVPVTFNTGQILMGLAAGVVAFGERYRRPMRQAADWLVATQDHDGCWRSHPTPFAAPGEKTYETHVAWGLLEASRVEGPAERRYADAALANVHWALGRQRANGWLADCCLSDPARPLTHTLGYALRGVLEAYRFSQEGALLAAARRTGQGLLSALRDDGFLPGRLDEDWRAAASWSCLTGTVQVAHCWLLLYEATGEARYLAAAQAANRYVRTRINVEGPPETRGGVQGSWPVDGAYGKYQYLNWAAKFLIDANFEEQRLVTAE